MFARWTSRKVVRVGTNSLATPMGALGSRGAYWGTFRTEIDGTRVPVLVDQVPFVPILSFNLNMAVVKVVHGLLPDIRGTYTYFNDVWIEKPIQEKWRG